MIEWDFRLKELISLHNLHEPQWSCKSLWIPAGHHPSSLLTNLSFTMWMSYSSISISYYFQRWVLRRVLTPHHQSCINSTRPQHSKIFFFTDFINKYMNKFCSCHGIEPKRLQYITIQYNFIRHVQEWVKCGKIIVCDVDCIHVGILHSVRSRGALT